jgi:hypothetical protein
MEINLRLDGTDIFFIVAVIAAILLVCFYFLGERHRSDFTALSCKVRRIVRRGSWYFLFPVVVLAYPFFNDLIIWWQVQKAEGGDAAQKASVAAAKMVDEVQFYSKSLVAVSNFCLINALGWAALLVIPVVVDWATGHYSKPENAQAVGLEAPVTGFKRTFLNLSGAHRIGFYLLVWAIELAVAGESVYSAFRMQ